MIFFVILGVVLGVVSVVFVSQNTDVVTVSFLTRQFEGSLALVLLLTLISGAAVTLLVLLPSFIRDSFLFNSVKREKKDLEAELAAAKQALRDAEARSASPEGSVV